MYKVGDVVICKRDVCKIQNIKEDGSGTRYYIMNPIDDFIQRVLTTYDAKSKDKSQIIDIVFCFIEQDRDFMRE